MKKTILILSIFAFIASSCNQTTKKSNTNEEIVFGKIYTDTVEFVNAFHTEYCGMIEFKKANENLVYIFDDQKLSMSEFSAGQMIAIQWKSDSTNFEKPAIQLMVVKAQAIGKSAKQPEKKLKYYHHFKYNTNTCYDYEGTLGEAPIQLSICFFENDEYWTGSYCYKKYENKIQLAGGINDGQMELTEFLDGSPNGYFKGKLITTDTDDRFEGTWTDASGAKQLDFNLTLKSSVGYNEPEQRYSDFSESEEVVEKFMKKIKLSIKNSDKEWVADNIRYPLNTTLNGKEKITIKNKQQLIDNFEQIFYPAYKEEINKHCVCNMFYNSQGIMLGNGDIWINGTEIIAINN
jgi:hypothetical protein